MGLTVEDQREAQRLLRNGSLFRFCTSATLAAVVGKLDVFQFTMGEKILEQGIPSENMFIVSSGKVVRYREDAGVEHQVDAGAKQVGKGGGEMKMMMDKGLHAASPSGVYDDTREYASSVSISSPSARPVAAPTLTNSPAMELQVDQNQHGLTINSMHSLSGDPCYATATCMSEQCKTFALSQKHLRDLLSTNPQLSSEIIYSLQKEVRDQKNALRTPFLELKNREDINVPAVSMAAAIESYYRSALNAMLNARLLGAKASYFPNMHVQVPARVLYINGFKGLRAFFDRKVKPEDFPNPTAIRYAAAIAPGIIMNPVSSVLEASNAGHMNSEPLYRRWMRGFAPRAVREVIFGVGLNQLSDFFEERWKPFVSNPTFANAAGSLTAGVVSGYLSHVPHNLSAYKLMDPSRSYGEHFRRFVDTSVPEALVPNSLPPRIRQSWRTILAVVFPRGCMIRTTQIVGSFMILNGTIGYLARLDQERVNRAFGEGSTVPVIE